MNWPTLTTQRADTLAAKARDAQNALTEVAQAITHYPGGGSPAHRARTAADNAGLAATHIENMRPS